MKILIISRTSWRNDNSFGNSFSNIFGGTQKLELHNIYCSTGVPDNSVVSSYFQFTEKMIIKSIFKKTPAGKKVHCLEGNVTENVDELNTIQKKGFAFFQRNRFQLFFWLRDIIWSFLDLNNSDSFKKYIADVNPDIIFLPVYYSTYTNRIGLNAKSLANVPMVGYISDDNYTLRQFSLSPLYWIDRFIKRGYVKRSIDKCQTLFVISDVQKKDYDSAFNKNCRVLYKGGSFKGVPPLYTPKIGSVCQFVFTGNIGDRRYENLSTLGKVLDEINERHQLAELHIYTPTQLTKKIQNALNCESITVHSAVSFSQVKKIQQNADILIHTESFQLQKRLQARHSFSTKIVDYLSTGRAILAIGPISTASVKYLANNNAAFIAYDIKRLKKIVSDIIQNPIRRKEVIENAWQCGQRNHQIDKIQAELINELTRVLSLDVEDKKTGISL